MLRADGAPLTPGGSQARELLRQELAKPEYQEREGIVQRAVDWVLEKLREAMPQEVGGLPSLGWLVGLLLISAVAILAVTFLRRGPAPAVAQQSSVLGERAMTAAELRRRAAEHQRGGDYEQAFVDYFRALAVRSVERVLVDVAPGLTAHDIARSMGARFPDADADLIAAAAMFDAVLYGDRAAQEHDCTRIRDLEQRIAAARPAVPMGAGG